MKTAIVQEGFPRGRIGYPQGRRPGVDTRGTTVGPVTLAANPVTTIRDTSVHAVLERALLRRFLDVCVGSTAAGFRESGTLVKAGTGAIVPLCGGVSTVVDSGVGDTHCEGYGRWE